jgi:hypothetical protein
VPLYEENHQLELARLRALYAHQDDCLIAISQGRSVPTRHLQSLPPWRAALIARVADRAGIPLEHGTLDQLVAEAARVTGAGRLGYWWEGKQ